MWPGQYRAAEQQGAPIQQSPSQRQVASLHEHYPSRVSINATGTKYEVALLLGPHHVPLVVSIELPANFPTAAPEFRVKDPKNVTHPWIQAGSEGASILQRLSLSPNTRITGHPSLSFGGWRGGYDITIGQILKDIETEFNRNMPKGLPNPLAQTPAFVPPQQAFPPFGAPPSPVNVSGYGQPMHGHIQAHQASTGGGQMPSQAYQSAALHSHVPTPTPAPAPVQTSAPVSHPTPPVRQRRSDSDLAKHVAPEFPEVENITFAQLRGIMEDDARFEEFFDSTKAAKDSRAAHEELVQSVMSQAHTNIKLFEEVSELKNRLYDLQGLLKIEEAELQSFVEANQSVFDSLRPQGLLAAIQSDASSLERAAELLYDAHCRGEIDAPQFVADYTAARVEVAMHEAAALKFQQLLKE